MIHLTFAFVSFFACLPSFYLIDCPTPNLSQTHHHKNARIKAPPLCFRHLGHGTSSNNPGTMYCPVCLFISFPSHPFYNFSQLSLTEPNPAAFSIASTRPSAQPALTSPAAAAKSNTKHSTYIPLHSTSSLYLCLFFASNIPTSSLLQPH